MCGLAGIVDFDLASSYDDIDKMIVSLNHRGPDTNGKWISEDSKIKLAHSRLAIHDLSELGHQPMVSECGDYVLVFNGEIYNFKLLKQELEQIQCKFIGNSDTEVLLKACIQWGVEASVKKLSGMFAFAILNKKSGELKIARDRLGEKPLYYYTGKRCFLFASELSSIKKTSRFTPSINFKSIYHFLNYGYTPSLDTVYEDVHKLAPGTILTLDINSGETQSELYWDISKIYTNSRKSKLEGSIDDLILELDRKLRNSVDKQLVSDVPLGAFLSGGIDSSLICGVASKLSNQKLKTFSVGFNEKEFDESSYARKIAEYLDTEHQEITVSQEQCLALLPRLHELYDEPFFDPSAVPTLLLSEFTRKNVTVALSGDGGDELFWGYNRYQNISERYLKVKGFSKLGKITGAFAEKHMSLLRSLPYGSAAARACSTLGARSHLEFYKKSRQIFNNGDLNKLFPNYSEQSIESSLFENNSISDLPFSDLNDYLPNDILVKVDRAAMSNSLETRIPLLDHELVEFSMRLPDQYKLSGKEGKCILKKVLSKYVPTSYFDRPKKGFSIPLASWLRGGLANYCMEIISLAKTRNVLDLNYVYIEFLFEQHKKGKADHSSRLWAIVILLQYFLKEESVIGV